MLGAFEGSQWRFGEENIKLGCLETQLKLSMHKQVNSPQLYMFISCKRWQTAKTMGFNFEKPQLRGQTGVYRLLFHCCNKSTMTKTTYRGKFILAFSLGGIRVQHSSNVWQQAIDMVDGSRRRLRAQILNCSSSGEKGLGCHGWGFPETNKSGNGVSQK